MGNKERRNFMALDDAYYYCKHLEDKLEEPKLYSLCSAIRTIEAALQLAQAEYGKGKISTPAWSQVHATLFDLLIRSFPGYFLVYDENSSEPLETGSKWPSAGHIEFYPEAARRRDDNYCLSLNELKEETHTTLRYCFAEGHQQINPSDFPAENKVNETDELDVDNFMTQLNEICILEAKKGKKRAHEQWWQLYWQANSSQDRQARHALQKKMSQLQSVWGRPS